MQDAGPDLQDAAPPPEAAPSSPAPSPPEGGEDADAKETEGDVQPDAMADAMAGVLAQMVELRAMLEVNARLINQLEEKFNRQELLPAEVLARTHIVSHQKHTDIMTDTLHIHRYNTDTFCHMPI